MRTLCLNTATRKFIGKVIFFLNIFFVHMQLIYGPRRRCVIQALKKLLYFKIQEYKMRWTLSCTLFFNVVVYVFFLQGQDF